MLRMIAAMMMLVAPLGCVDDGGMDPDKMTDCGPMPSQPYWEYTEVAGAPPQAMVPLHLWLQDLEWRKSVLEWGACMQSR